MNLEKRKAKVEAEAMEKKRMHWNVYFEGCTLFADIAGDRAGFWYTPNFVASGDFDFDSMRERVFFC